MGILEFTNSIAVLFDLLMFLFLASDSIFSNSSSVGRQGLFLSLNCARGKDLLPVLLNGAISCSLLVALVLWQHFFFLIRKIVTAPPTNRSTTTPSGTPIIMYIKSFWSSACSVFSPVVLLLVGVSRMWQKKLLNGNFPPIVLGWSRQHSWERLRPTMYSYLGRCVKHTLAFLLGDLSKTFLHSLHADVLTFWLFEYSSLNMLPILPMESICSPLLKSKVWIKMHVFKVTCTETGQKVDLFC